MNNIFSNQIRESFIKKFDSSSYSLDEFISTYEQYIYLILDTKEKSLQKIYTYIELIVSFSDLYRILIHKRNQNMLTTEDYFYLSQLEEVIELDDLIPEISSVPSFLEQMLKAMVEFHNMPFLGKVSVMQSLSEEDYDYLNQICPILDEKEQYLREITLTDYVEHIENQTDKIILSEEYNVSPDHFVEEICGFMLNLSKYDYENFSNNIKDLLIPYYEYGKYTIDHDKSISQIPKENIEQIVSLFEDSDLENIIQEILYNRDILFALVDFFLNVYKSKKIFYEDGFQVTYQEVENYIENIEDEKVKQKMKYKKTRI